MRKYKQKRIMKLMQTYHLPVALNMYPGLSAYTIVSISTYVRCEMALASLDSYRNLEDLRYKVLRKYASNNWLKMHGLPMRRKGL